MTQQTIEVSSVRRTDDPPAISQTDGGFRAFSSADLTNSDTASESGAQRRTVALRRASPADALAQDHVYLVRQIARTLARKLSSDVDLDDLIGDGRVGLVEAARAFDPTRGVAFKTFAQHRIRGAMLDGMRALDSRSREMHAQHRVVDHTISLLANLLGRFPTDSELADSMGFEEERWRQMRRRLHAAGYLLLIDPPRHATPAPDSLPGPVSDPEALAANLALRTKLDDALRTIPPRYRAVIILYHISGWTMKEIGIKIGVNASRVSQLNKSAIAMLRSRISARRADFSL